VIKAKEKRKVHFKKAKHKNAWYGFGLFGLVGWSITVPALIGLAVGIYIDTEYPSRYLFSLMGFILGLLFGIWIAFYWINREQKEIEKETENDR